MTHQPSDTPQNSAASRRRRSTRPALARLSPPTVLLLQSTHSRATRVSQFRVAPELGLVHDLAQP